MKCKLCGSNDIHIIYQDVIRNGGLGHYTAKPVSMFQCSVCGVIWHEPIVEDMDKYYESLEYRAVMDEGSDEETFYRLHDRETLNKFQYTGTDIYRHKIVADVGCGGGGFLDYLKGVADSIVAIEPSAAYRKVLQRKGYHTYAYVQNAVEEWGGNKVDVVTSFDVIEHVENPRAFVEDIYDLLCPGGIAVIGTPTDAPVMRQLLGSIYEKQILFSVQHLWILTGENLCTLAHEAGFRDVEIHYYQRYGIENMLGWCLEKAPNSCLDLSFLGEEINAVWKSICADRQMADYVVLRVKK